MGASLSSMKCSSSSYNIEQTEKIARADSMSVSLLRVPSLRYLKRRRGSVSAESGKPTPPEKGTLVPKPQDTHERIARIILGIPLFRELDDSQRRRVVDAMTERHVSAGDVFITEGEEGDFFYAIESGRYAAKKNGEVKFVYDGSGSFGELALLYNSPRAATVVAETEGTLWALDRPTFRALVIGGWQERRKAQEAHLKDMQLFKDLTDVQRAAIADCLSPVTFQRGATIIAQGEPITSTSQFFIVVEGQVDCFRTVGKGMRQVTRSVGPGQVFGEVALVTKCPRQADCIATTETVKCLTLARDAFERLMGPVEEILRLQIESYKKMDAEKRRSTGP